MLSIPGREEPGGEEPRGSLCNTTSEVGLNMIGGEKKEVMNMTDDKEIVGEEFQSDGVTSGDNFAEATIPTSAPMNGASAPSFVHAQPSSSENVQVCTTDVVLTNNNSNHDGRYKLPERTNRGKPPARYSPEQRTKWSRYPIHQFVSSAPISPPLQDFAMNMTVVAILGSVREALRDPNWVGAMEEEMRAMRVNESLRLMPLLEGKKTMGCKWVFTVKYKADGNIQCFKARFGCKRVFTIVRD